jgi:hypothetical protein
MIEAKARTPTTERVFNFILLLYHSFNSHPKEEETEEPTQEALGALRRERQT